MLRNKSIGVCFSISAFIFFVFSANFVHAFNDESKLANDSPLFYIGVGTHVAQNKATAAEVFRLAALLGVNSLRDEIYWDDIERVRGVLNLPLRLRELDLLYKESAQRGISPLIILNYGNRHYQGGGFPTEASSIEAFSAYVSWVVTRYRDSVNVFEIWNEWNNGIGLPKEIRSPGSPESYIQLLKSASAAVKHANPTAKVIGGAVAGFDEAWIVGFLKAGGMKYVDGFSVHPYVFFDRKGSTPCHAIRNLDRLNDLVLQYVGRSIPIYVTEIGWPTHVGRSGVSDTKQTEYVSEFVSLARNRSWVKGVWWYELKDSGSNPLEPEHRFGIFNEDGRFKSDSRPNVNSKNIPSCP
jgi:hypothetical protein